MNGSGPTVSRGGAADARSADRARLEVVHLTHTSESGGAELALRRMLDQDLWSARVLVPRGATSVDSASAAAVAGSRPVYVEEIGPAQPPRKTQRGLGGVIDQAVGIVRQARAIRASEAFRSADVVYTNTSRALLYGAILRLSSRKPLVAHLRDYADKDALGRAGSILFKLCLFRVDGVVSNSEATLRTIPQLVRRTRPTAVIPSPIGIKVSAEDLPRGRETPKEVRIIGMVARIDPWKGQRELITAFAREFLHTTTRLRLVGGPAFDQHDYLDELVVLCKQLDVQTQVDFVGQVADVWSEIAAFDIAVHASTRPEPLGQNILQYLALRRPLVAAGAGGPLEWVEHGRSGLLFDPDDETSLPRTLRVLADDVELRQAMTSGRDGRRPILSDREVAIATVDFLNTFAGPARSRSERKKSHEN